MKDLTEKVRRGMYISMNETSNTSPNQTKVIHTLAVVGFIALIGSGMALAVYSTRYVPDVVGRLGSAAVYLGSVFTPAPEASLSVVPTASSTIISFGESTSTTTTTTTKTVATTESKPVATTAGQKTTTTTQIGGTTVPKSTLSGLPDLIVTIKAVGYLNASSTDSFIATSTVPVGNRPAVAFTIKNIGTNKTGAWRFSASIPTQTSYLYQSQLQQALNPGDSIDYTLGFDQANAGAGQTISITANFDNTVVEATTNNNSASAKLTIIGS